MTRTFITKLRQAARAWRPISGVSNVAHSRPLWTKPLELSPLSPRRVIPSHILHPPYVLPTGEFTNPRKHRVAPEIKDAAAIEGMRKAGMYASYLRAFAASKLKVGVTTDYIDEQLHNECIRLNIYPAALGFSGFPKSVCTSVNQVVCHGIPDYRVLEDGDIINIDVTVFVEGYFGDCSNTFCVGNVDEAGCRLVESVREATAAAIERCGPNQPFSVIGDACQTIADRDGYSIVRDFCAHGIGTELHQPPNIWHHRNNRPEVMLPGMTFTIEPMFNEGDMDIEILHDQWTIVTKDQQRSAQCEQTLLITDSGYEILTKH